MSDLYREEKVGWAARCTSPGGFCFARTNEWIIRAWKTEEAAAKGILGIKYSPVRVRVTVEELPEEGAG